MPGGYSDITDFAPIREKREPSPFDPILEKARDLVCERLEDAVSDMLDKADEVLLALVKETQNRDERALYETAREVAMEQRDIVQTHFQQLYRSDFQQRSDRARKIGKPFDAAEVSLDELELVGEDDLEETLKFNDMANKLRAYCDEELVALDQRVGVLLGDASLQAKDNPFSPQVICDAFKLACRQLEADAKVRRVLLKLFDDHVLDDIRSVYKDVNALLVRHSILPKIRYNVARGKDKAADGTSAEAQASGSGEHAAVGAGQDLFAILQKLVGSAAGGGGVAAGAGAGGGVALGPGAGGPAAAGSFPTLNSDGAGPGVALPAGAVVVQGAELIGLLTRIQQGDTGTAAGANVAIPAGSTGVVNVLHELKSSSVGAGMSPLDSMTLDIIAMLFDQLFDEPKVPNGVKGLIGRLQIPMLKVAIADKSFFSTKAHPARRLLDALGEIAMRLPADFSAANPMFDRIQAILQELVDGFQDNLEIFTTVREQLLALIAEEDQRIEDETQSTARHLEDMEKLALAKSVAQEEIRTRVEAHMAMPVPVREFLVQQWLKLLLLVHVKEGVDSQSWKDALEAMDQLIWSVTPKPVLEDKRKLASMLPALIKQLTAGLSAAGIEDGVRVSFFSDLMDLHKQAVSAPGPGVESAAGIIPSDQPHPLAVLARKNAPSESLDFTTTIEVKNPFGEGQVSVESNDLDFTAEAERGARAKREASIMRALENLKAGTWVEFREGKDQPAGKPLRLIFVSPRKTRYLFAADRAGKEIVQCTRAEMSRRFRIGEAVKLDEPPEESLFDRIMGKILGKLRTPGRTTLFPA